jgi:hypothetical protein
MFDLHAHTLRKYFQTKCKLAGCKTSFVDLWLGHVVGEYLNGSYFRPDIRESFNEYKKAIPALTIFSKAEEIKIELAELKEKVAELQTFYEIIRDVIPENLLVRLQLEKLHREYSGASEAPISLKKNDEKR